MPTFTSFDDFFRYYIGEHSKSATRWVHFVATHLGLAVGLTGLVRRSPRLIALAPLCTYGPAFASHFVIEKNRPVTVGGNVLYAMRGDLTMTAMMWQGRDAELGEMAARNLASRRQGTGFEPSGSNGTSPAEAEAAALGIRVPASV